MKLTVETTYKNCKAYRAFVDQINGATMRHIPFHMTFAEWQWVWLSSGKWEERGNKGHQFCMARRGPDIGPYAVGNVDIRIDKRRSLNSGVTRAAISSASGSKASPRARKRECA